MRRATMHINKVNMLSHYQFRSIWRLPASTQVVWTELTTPKTWQRWWPGLVRVEAREAAGEQIGQVIGLTFRALAGYKLAFTLTVTTLTEPRLIEFISQGDLDGTGTWSIAADGSGSVITIDWQVGVTKPWMVRVGPVLRPLFSYSHGVLMRRGERGLRRYLAATANSR